MPRIPSTTAASPPTPPNVLQLRTQWKWAAFTQFYHTFAPLFSLSDVAITDIENDLTLSTNIFLPRVMQRLLYTLTLDRKVSPDNWQNVLRRQYTRRDPLANPIGPGTVAATERFSEDLPERGPENTPAGSDNGSTTSPIHHPPNIVENDVEDSERLPPSATQSEYVSHSAVREDSKNWDDLPMLVKLDSMHLLAEWQFQNPLRLRSFMKDDDETAQWRIEPIGYDSKHSAYWLIGADRLWVQRAPPKPRSLKRSSLARADGNHKRKPQENHQRRSTKRRRIAPSPITSTSFTLGRSSRLSQAKNDRKDKRVGETANSNSSIKGKSRAAGTRASARLRADISEEGWQVVPEEWLADNRDHNVKSEHGNSLAKREMHNSGLESGGEFSSDLTELSSDNSETENGTEEVTSAIRSEDHNVPCRDAHRCHAPPPDFLEWETICVTLSDWENSSKLFENSTHYAEKALHSVLVSKIVPAVTADLMAAERKYRLAEALVHRKRSSRIAIKESEKEEARLIARKKADCEEKLSRARRLEVRLQKEEAERQRREAARDQRRREREAKEESERKAAHSLDVVGCIPEEARTEEVALQSVLPGSSKAISTKPQAPLVDDWVVDCEICHGPGIIHKGKIPLTRCGNCLKWQHISCHDAADLLLGRPKRNWAVEAFLCRACYSKTLPPVRHSGLEQYPHGNSFPFPPPSGSQVYSNQLEPRQQRSLPIQPPHAEGFSYGSFNPPSAEQADQHHSIDVYARSQSSALARFNSQSAVMGDFATVPLQDYLPDTSKKHLTAETAYTSAFRYSDDNFSIWKPPNSTANQRPTLSSFQSVSELQYHSIP